MTSTLNDNASTNDNGYTFTVTLSNPCRSADLNSPSLSAMTVDDGATGTQDFTDVSDTHGYDYGNTNFCGARTFTVEDQSGNAISWMSVALNTGSTYTITASPVSSNQEL